MDRPDLYGFGVFQSIIVKKKKTLKLGDFGRIGAGQIGLGGFLPTPNLHCSFVMVSIFGRPT
jgi:hypothetical protein